MKTLRREGIMFNEIPRARQDAHVARMTNFLGRIVRMLAAVVVQRFDRRGSRHGMFPAERVVGKVHQVMRSGRTIAGDQMVTTCSGLL